LQLGAERLAAGHRIPTFLDFPQTALSHQVFHRTVFTSQNQSGLLQPVSSLLRAIRKPPHLLGVLAVCGRRIRP